MIHTAFIHDFSNYAAAAQTDRLAIETLGTVLAGSGRPFVVTSGTALLAPGRLGREQDAPDPCSPAAPRIASEEAALAKLFDQLTGGVGAGGQAPPERPSEAGELDPAMVARSAILGVSPALRD